MPVVLKCPYCGGRVNKGDNYCSHCGKQFDQPHIDDVSTAYNDGAAGLVILVLGFVIWFVIALILSLICAAFNLTPDCVIPMKISFYITMGFGVICLIGWIWGERHPELND